MIHIDNITGLVLAGGAGTRVGGQDKGLLLWNGTPLAALVARKLQPQTGQVLISCNRNLDEYRQLGFPIIEDERANFQGPLAGIEAARELIETEYLAVVACDTPSLPADLVSRLLSPMVAGRNPKPMISYAHDGQREQFLFSVLDVRCLEGLPKFLEQGHRAVKYWYRENAHVVVNFSDQREAFQNYNYLGPC